MTQQTVIPLGEGAPEFIHILGKTNQLLIQELSSLIARTRVSNTLFYWGGQGSGKSYVLEAMLGESRKRGGWCHVMKLQQGLEQIEAFDDSAGGVFGVDDLQLVQSSKKAQLALFSLYEKIRMDKGCIVLNADRPISAMDISIKDLASRLSIGGSFRLEVLSDQELIEALGEKAKQRGFVLEEKVLNYLLTHYSRDAISLFSMLDKLDYASLQAQKKITIPFVKAHLNERVL